MNTKMKTFIPLSLLVGSTFLFSGCRKEALLPNVDYIADDSPGLLETVNPDCESAWRALNKTNWREGTVNINQRVQIIVEQRISCPARRDLAIVRLAQDVSGSSNSTGGKLMNGTRLTIFADDILRRN